LLLITFGMTYVLSKYLSVETEAVFCYYLVTKEEWCWGVTHNFETICFIWSV